MPTTRTRPKTCSRGHAFRKSSKTLVCSKCWPGYYRKQSASGIRYLALLRGINVGGKNSIKMTALAACFEDMGFKSVTTYIQSGNVLFASADKNNEMLTKKIENALSKRFNYASRVVLVSHQELQDIVKRAPKGFGKNPAAYRYDVIFLKKPLTARATIKQVSVKDGVDDVHIGKNVLYFSRLISKVMQSRLSRIIQLPIYQDMTIRNWNTTSNVLALMQTMQEKI